MHEQQVPEPMEGLPDDMIMEVMSRCTSLDAIRINNHLTVSICVLRKTPKYGSVAADQMFSDNESPGYNLTQKFIIK